MPVDEHSPTFERLVGGIAKYISSAPNRAAPGPLGSRFEHWGVLVADDQALEAGAEAIVNFLVLEL